MEQTVILIKPDGMKRGLIGKIIDRFEQAGFWMVAAKLIRMDDELLNVWYTHHLDKDFFPSLCAFMKETPVLAMIWEGENVVEGARQIAGPTDPKKAPKGTLRGDFGTENPRNIIHASDSVEAAEKE
ncbi:nucleoside-diphosphate kinase, partial [Candidatus Gottesmanbacteria bacterium]|nr:nucleoside-diphosphate kinase [Candidatus Gottesmanbacteria bacterium]